jgi:hypothetical protein
MMFTFLQKDLHFYFLYYNIHLNHSISFENLKKEDSWGIKLDGENFLKRVPVIA